MTDIEKILAKIELLLDETNYEPYTDEVLGRIQSLKELKSYIDSLQEDPVSIWHDSNKEQPDFASTVAIWNPKYKNGEIISRCTEVYSDRIWAYIDDLLKI